MEQLSHKSAEERGRVEARRQQTWLVFHTFTPPSNPLLGNSKQNQLLSLIIMQLSITSAAAGFAQEVFHPVCYRPRSREAAAGAMSTTNQCPRYQLVNPLLSGALLVHSGGSVDIPPALLKGDYISSEIWSVLYTGGEPHVAPTSQWACDFPALSVYCQH